MFKELNEFKSMKNILKKDLMEAIKELANKISVHDLMLATVILREEGKYVQSSYREGYLEIYIKYFIMRIKDVKEDKNYYNSKISNESDFF